MKRAFLFLFGLLLVNSSFSSETDFLQLFTGGFKSIYNFEFTKADSVFSELKKKHSGESRTYVLGANDFWWKIRSGDDNAANRKEYSACLDELEKLLDKKKAAKQMKPDDIFQYINLHSYRARLELLDNNYVKVFSHMNKCNPFIALSSGSEDSYEPFNLTSGLYNCFMSIAKKSHPLFAPYFLFAPDCDMEKGLKQLNKCGTSENVLLNTEANYFLMIFYGEGEVDYNLSAFYAEKLSSQYSNNLLYQYYLFKVKLLSGNLESAMKNLILLFQKSKSAEGLNETQRKYFTDMAGKDMQEYYKKHPTEKSEN